MAENWWEEDELASSEETSETSSEDNWWEEDEIVQNNTLDVPVQPTVAEDKPDAISTQMYEGMSFEEANKYYNDLLQKPNVAPPVAGVGFAIFTDPNTGKKEYIPRPQPNMLKAAGEAILETVAAPFSEEASLKGAAETFLNPDATVPILDKAAMGFAESAGAIVEAGAAGLKSLG